ncbi:hypothetical protein [Georgenia daeguensis]
MADRGTASGGDSLGKGIGLLMAPILGILPYVLPADAVPDELRSVFWIVPLLMVGVAYLIRPGGVFARDRFGPTLLGRIIAGLLGVVYVVGTALLLSTETSVFWATLVVGSLYASALLMVRAAHQVEWSDAALSLATVLGGVALLLMGVADLRDGNLLWGVARLLLGVAVLLGGVAFLRDGNLLVGVALLLGGVAVLLLGVAFLRDGNLLWGVALLLLGVGALLAGVGALLWGVALLLAGVALLLAGVAGLLVGVASLRDGNLLVGVALLLLGVAALLFGVEVLRDGYGAPGWRRWVEQAVSRLTRRDEAEAPVRPGEGPQEGGESE